MSEPSPAIRLIWDFFGPHAERTARHHRSHLDDFTQRESVQVVETGVDAGEGGHWMAWMVVPAFEVDRVRQALRPQRGLAA